MHHIDWMAGLQAFLIAFGTFFSAWAMAQLEIKRRKKRVEQFYREHPELQFETGHLRGVHFIGAPPHITHPDIRQELVYARPHVTEEDMARVFSEGVESGSLAEIGRAMAAREENPLDRLHNFIMMHEVRFVEVIKDGSHECYSDREQAWSNIVGSLQQGWRISQAETAPVQSLPEMYEFGNPQPIRVDEGNKIVVRLHHPRAPREGNMAVRAPRVITEEWLWGWMMGRRPHAWILHIHNNFHEETVALPDRQPAMEACHLYMSQGYRVVEMEQRLVNAPDWTIGDWQHPAPDIPRECDIHIHLDPPSNNPSRFYCATAAVPEERMTHTELQLPSSQEADAELALLMETRARLDAITRQAMGVPQEMFTSGSAFGPTAGSTFAYVGGRRGGQRGGMLSIDEARRMFFDDDERQGRYQHEAKERDDALKAKKKALELFMSCLTKEELAEFKTFSTVTIWNKLGVFRIDAQTDGFGSSMPPTYNVYSGNEVYCVNVATEAPAVRNNDGPTPPSTNYPFYDHILAQMLILKHDPERFLKTANKRGR